MNNRLRSLIVVAAFTVAATPALGSAQTWASWNLPGTCGAPVTGALGAATVTYSGIYNGVQNANYDPTVPGPNPNALGCTAFGFGGFDSWALTPDGVYDGQPGNPLSTKPNNPSFIQMVNENQDAQGNSLVNTITFSKAVIDPYIALHSVGNTLCENGTSGCLGVPVTYTFFSQFTELSYNDKESTPWVGLGFREFTNTATTWSVTGREYSGLLQFKGTFTSLSFKTANSENWHAWTVGAASVVPEPSSFALIGAGLLALGVAARRRRTS